MPYAAPFIGIVLKKCGKKTSNPGNFSMQLKYGTMLTTLFVTFAYGFTIPFLFMAAGICFLVQFFLDKVLVTYWYKFLPIKSDMSAIQSISTMKYAPCILILYTAVSLY